MCSMPFSQDTGKRENDEFCSYCFKDGKVLYEGDLKGFQDICYKAMREKGMGFLKAKFFTWCIRFAPYWKSKK